MTRNGGDADEIGKGPVDADQPLQRWQVLDCGLSNPDRLVADLDRVADHHGSSFRIAEEQYGISAGALETQSLCGTVVLIDGDLLIGDHLKAARLQVLEH